MNKEHSKLPPSSAARRMACPGSGLLEYHYGKKEESEASKEGVFAHKVAADSLMRYKLDGYESTIDVPEDMLEHADYYSNIVSFFLPARSLRIEERVDCTNIHPEMWGTCDAWGVDVDEKSLHVFDYKYGFTPVEAFENWQLLAYACGIIKDFKYIKYIYLHIVQPRDYLSKSKHKQWKITRDELENYRLQLADNSNLVMGPGAQLNPSSECKYCSVRYMCPALKIAALNATELASQESEFSLDPKQVGSELKLLHEARDHLDYRITALESEVQHLLQAGQSVEHYELTPVEGRMTWTGNEKEIIGHAILQGINIIREDIITPTQAIKAGMNKETVLKYSERKQSLKLSKIDVKKSKAVFSKQQST